MKPTLIGVIRFWMAYPLLRLSGVIGGPLFREVVLQSYRNEIAKESFIPKEVSAMLSEVRQ